MPAGMEPMAWVHQTMSVLKLHTMATAIMTKKVTTPNTARSTMSFAVRRPEAARGAALVVFAVVVAIDSILSFGDGLP